MNKVIKKISRVLEYVLLRFKVRCFREFNKKVLLDHFDLGILEINKKKIEPYYTQYVKHVSSPEMAASLELAGSIYTICRTNQYTKLLDMGSGLSSFILRLYAQETAGVKVYSVDDDAAWLEKTMHYLKEQGLETENMYTLEEFIKLEECGFDCILHDLNFVEVRINYVELVINAAKQNGLIIMDDVHKPDYPYALLEKLDGMPVHKFNLKPITLDIYGRYAFAVLKK